jgi:CheY-like chemotaxis protein
MRRFQVVRYSMRLENVNPALIRSAIELFLGAAWGELAPSHWPRIDLDHGDVSHALTQFKDERRRGKMRKFALRLGNRRYPFMKLVFQELLLRDVFFFSVDTHDDMEVKETMPDFAEWQSIRAHNAQLKRAIESSWREAGVPTFDDVLTEVERQSAPPPPSISPAVQPLILIVDDDAAIVRGVRLILERHGYRTDVASSAEEALTRVRAERPDVILSDLEMGNGLTGLQLCQKLRATKGHDDIPFVLATAAEVDLGAESCLDGFLIKPYEIDVLVRFVAERLRKSAAES